ncbi:LPXTG cell wall anchor domain-containing protein, partial [Candidatus Woesearchaeota archaeon]|nr:LPXTG cell wall anchor domain-containing protein [Candidatus Woesearchaeota archaeon]
EISLDNQTYDKALNITITTPNTNDWENLTPTELQFNATAIGGEVRLAELSNLKLMAPQDNPTHSYGYTSYGTFINYYQPTDDPQTLTIDYPENQLEALAYFENGGSHTRYLTNLGNGTYNLNLTYEDIFNGTHNKSIIFHVDISELMDSDDDGINDPYDYLIGNISSINSTISNINMSINSSDNFTKMFNSSFLVNITNGTNNLVDFTYNFSQSCPLNLSNITINTEIVNNKGALTITGINPSCVVGTKTIYVDDINTNSVVCVHDAEIVSVSEIAAQCNGADETIVACTTNGHTQGGYTCTDLGDKLRIEGLTHSGVQQMNCTDNDRDGYGTGCSSGSDCNDDDASKTANCGSNGGGGGGGGGSSTKITCAESWSCTAWQPTLCPETSRQTRQCTDSTNCGTIANKPSESRGCYYPKPKEEVKEEEIVEEIKEEVKAKSVEPEKERGLLAITGNFILDGLKKGSKTTGVITIAGIVVLGLAGYIFIKKKF